MDDSLKPDFFNSLLIVLVIYKMKINESPAYQSLTAALNGDAASLFIYDNSPDEQALPIHAPWNFNYVSDPLNPGVSKAYNEGFKMARELNKKWLLLADQDTFFPLNIFAKYEESMTAHQSHELFSPIVKSAFIVSPFCFAWGRGYSMKNVRPGHYKLSDYKFVNSGLLVSLNLYKKCRGYDERFPLDFSDLAFIERARNIVEEFVVIDAVCAHSLSSMESLREMAIPRFDYFIRASKAYGHFYGSSFFLSITRFLRAIKLSYQFRSLVFLKLLDRN